MNDTPLPLETRIIQPADRISHLEADIARHSAQFEERNRAEIRAEQERVLAAQAIKDALDQAKDTNSKALEAAAKSTNEALITALKSANELEVSRIEKVGDKVADVKEAARLALEATEKLADNQDKSTKETLDHHNELLSQMNAKDATYATKDVLQITKENFDKRHVDDFKRVDDSIASINNILAADGREKSTKERVRNSVYGYIVVIATFSGGLMALLIHLLGG